jgi:hypothetical protein
LLEWQEKMDDHNQICLQISGKVERLIEDRRILREDLQKTIHHGETTGEKFINPSLGRSLASFRPERVTYWVEYSRVGEGYQIHSAYSHRMEMKRGGGP